MYKKFLVLTLLTIALAGCGHPSSDKQSDDQQVDDTLAAQSQAVNPASVMNEDRTTKINPPVAEVTQTTPDSTVTDEQAMNTKKMNNELKEGKTPAMVDPDASISVTPAVPDAKIPNNKVGGTEVTK